MKKRIVIATRESKLALWQARFIRERVIEAFPGVEVELVGMTTQGDRWLSSPLSEVGGKGLFIKELEEAMLDGRADLAVHSMKDVPAVLPDGFLMPLIGYRDDVRDALVCPLGYEGHDLDSLPGGAVVGSSSLRRQSMLLARRPDLVLKPVRGNVGTRLAKLDAGEYDALVLAAAGLNRLGLAGRISELLAEGVLLPAAGQGALGVECLADAAELIDMLEALNDPQVSRCVTAERAVSASLGADCSAPLGAHAVISGVGLQLRARLSTPDGRTVLQGEASGDDPAALGLEVAGQLIAQGARELLAALSMGTGSG